MTPAPTDVDDYETQERVWFEANEWQRQSTYLRRAIARIEIDASRNCFVRFVGLGAYEAAGGYVRRDLFCDDEIAGWCRAATRERRPPSGYGGSRS